jgi:hypothetical protein
MTYIKKLGIIQWLLILLSLRSLIEINISQALVTIGIFCVFSYERWLSSKQEPEINDEVKKDIKLLKDQMSGILIKNTTKQNSSTEGRRLF